MSEWMKITWTFLIESHVLQSFAKSEELNLYEFNVIFYVYTIVFSHNFNLCNLNLRLTILFTTLNMFTLHKNKFYKIKIFNIF
jgi:hypothetical protein